MMDRRAPLAHGRVDGIEDEVAVQKAPISRIRAGPSSYTQGKEGNKGDQIEKDG